MVTQMPEQHPSEDDQVVVTCPTLDDSLKAHVNFIGREEVHPLELGSSSGLFELSVKCQFCADTFSSMEDLSAHISVLHTMLPSAELTGSQQGFKRLSSQ